jgi:GT2 family glycosyltransferase
MSMRPTVSISVVSHRQARLISQLLEDLGKSTIPLDILVTVNVPEAHEFECAQPLRVLRNTAPRGFGANHNAAFKAARGEVFCVVNPDVRVPTSVLSTLLESLRDSSLGVVAPRVTDPDGRTEDSARRFPTPLSILGKLLRTSHVESQPQNGISYPDWVAGMFMCFPSDVFSRVGGFDESYYLYYEDADICARLRKLGYRVGYCANVSVVHDARRTSHRNVRYMWWHMSSMARFFWKRGTGSL